MAPHSPRVTGRRSLLLLAALLPMLSYFGHWPGLAIETPVIGVHLALPHQAAEDGQPHAHAGHCHAESGSCANAAGHAIAFGTSLAAIVEAIGSDRPQFVLSLPGTRVPQGLVLAPDSPPPRSLA